MSPAIDEGTSRGTDDSNRIVKLWGEMDSENKWTIHHEDHEAFHAMLKSIVKPVNDEVPDPLAQLPPDMLLTVDEVLAHLPVKISRRGWLEGARTGRYPAAIHINRKTLRWKARDIQQYVALLMGALDAGEHRR